MKVFVDDKRSPYEGWTLAWSYKRAIELLESGGVEKISLDHDLGTGKTGYDIVCWIEKQVFGENLFEPPTIYCHSANCVGRDNILAAIARIQKEQARQLEVLQKEIEDAREHHR
jgi:hypothetical protein